MSLLGIITCKSMEEEIAYIINNENSEIARIYVLESKSSARLYNRLQKNKEKKEVTWIKTLEQLPPASKQLGMLVDVLEMGLHVNTNKLAEIMLQKLKDYEHYCSAIMINYGLCGNSLSNLEEKITPYNIPLIMPRNKDGTRVDDCIAALMGGNEEFRKELYNEPGTWFMPPGWVKNWDILLEKEWGSRDATALKWIFEKTGYKRLLAIPSPPHNEKEFYAHAEEFARNFGLELQVKEGTLEILQRTYRKAKKAAEKTAGNK